MITTLLMAVFLFDSCYFSLETKSDEKLWILSSEDETSGLYSPSCGCGCDKCKEEEEAIKTKESSTLFVRGDAREAMILPISEGPKIPLLDTFKKHYEIEIVGMTDEGQLIVSKTEEDLPHFLIEDSMGFAILEPNDL